MIFGTLLGPPPMRAATVQQLGHPAAGVIGWMGGNDVLSGVQVNEDSAMTYSAAWAATKLLAGTVASMPVGVIERLDNGGTHVDYKHPLFNLLYNAPNEEMTAAVWLAMGVAHQINWGNTYAEIERDGNGDVQALWPIHPSMVRVQRNDRRQLEYLVYANNGREALLFPANDIFHVTSSVIPNGITGRGVVEVARESIGFGIATERHGAAYFGNGGKPSVVVTHPRLMSPEARKNFRQEWQEIHGGVENNGKIALLQEGGDIKVLSFSPEDSQFLSTRQHNVEEVARWYGVPPHMIGHLTRSTYSNIEHQGMDFVRYSLNQWLVFWEAAAWMKLLNSKDKESHFIAFDVSELKEGDVAARTAANAQQWMNGALTHDEWRAKEGRNPIPNGNGSRHYIPLNMTTVDKAGEEPEVPTVPVNRFAPAQPAKDEEDDEPSDDAIKYIMDIRKAATAAVDDVCGLMAKKEIEAALTAARHPEDCLQRLEKFYEKHGERLAVSVHRCVATLLVALGDAREPKAVCETAAASHVNESKRQLWQALECMPHELEAAVSACVAGWAGRKLDLFTGA